ncbi:MAG TPA: diacylglycerol kinase family protein [Gemmatimonadales bacterium]|jgi:diacylglycerol kinase (ATP)|nr:diacylglycerol kinase family protein [Gemmatimonadales bacterium]
MGDPSPGAGSAPPLPSLAIVNPVAGEGRGAAVWRLVEPAVRALFPELAVETTVALGHAEALGTAWARFNPGGVLLVLGGDGTVHEVVNGLAREGAGVTLGVLPAGTGNDFARNTGIPLEPVAAVVRLAFALRRAPGGGPARHEEGTGAPVRRVDLGRVQFMEWGGESRTRVFLNSVSVGVGPRANRLAGRMRRFVPGRLRYAAGGVAALFSGSPERYRVTAGEQVRFAGEALNLTIANCACFGGGLRISPASSPDDGVLEQVVIGRLGLIRALLALGRLYAGTHVGMRGVSVTPVREALRIENGGGRMLVEADGQEFIAAGALTVEILPGALDLLR